MSSLDKITRARLAEECLERLTKMNEEVVALTNRVEAEDYGSDTLDILDTAVIALGRALEEMTQHVDSIGEDYKGVYQ